MAILTHRYSERIPGGGDGVDDLVSPGVNHRNGIAPVPDINLPAIWAYRHAEGPPPYRYRSDYRVFRRVDHRHGARVVVCDVGVLREAFGAAEHTGQGKGRDREQPRNVKVHSIRLDPREVVP